MAGRLKYPALRTVAIILIIFGMITFWVLRPIRDTDFSTPGFTPIRDQALAARFAPVILPHPVYGVPSRLFYRMAKSATGETHIAYHPFYEAEENPHTGFGAFMSRIIYTGGLHIKDLMFGPADIELIEVILDASGNPMLLAFEDTEKYNPKSFSVKHLSRTVQNPKPPFCFEAPTWNHMFAIKDASVCAGTLPLKVEYFSDSEWNSYRMVKKAEAILRRHRTHRVYERQAAPAAR